MVGYPELKNRSSWHSPGPGPHNSNNGTTSYYREPVSIRKQTRESIHVSDESNGV